MGRPKNIKSPAELLKHFVAYKTVIKKKPIKKHDYVGGMGKSVQRKLERPLTMVGFENHCFEQGIIADLKDYFSNKEGRYAAFAPICSRIRDIIQQDQIEGGMAGIYNPSITQRLNGLTDKTETKITGDIDVTLNL